jgi:hypothetical protein
LSARRDRRTKMFFERLESEPTQEQRP